MHIHHLNSLLIAISLSAVLLFPGLVHGEGYAMPMNVQNANMMIITIRNFQIMPQGIDVPQGTTIEWTNKDTAADTTTSDDMTASENWNSGTLQPGQSFTHTFNTVGTYAYHCNIHPDMDGTIHVIGNQQQVNSTYTPQNNITNDYHSYFSIPNRSFSRREFVLPPLQDSTRSCNRSY